VLECFSRSKKLNQIFLKEWRAIVRKDSRVDMNHSMLYHNIII